MNTQRQNGYDGTPLKLRTNARQADERATSKRYRQPPQSDDEQGDYYYETKPHTSAIRYDRSNAPRNDTAFLNSPKKTVLVRQRRFDRTTLITWLCLAIIVMVGGWWLFSQVANWWQGVQENMQYGNPRTFQSDQYVNLGDTPTQPDHFIALNLHGVIVVIQINPKDSKKDAIYPIANVGNNRTPASLSFRDTTGSGRMDVIVTIGDSTPYTDILVNNGKTLTPTQPAH